MAYVQLLRVKHWVKNFFLFLPLFFAGELFKVDRYPDLILGFLAFSLIASSIYIINDYRDIEADKIHPKKSKRPLASGEVAKSTAIVILIICLIAGFGIAYFLKPKFMFVAAIYFVMNLAYSFGLKNFQILDIIILAIGFNLRVKAGGVIASIAVSEWLTVMIFLLSLFLAVAKRRDDLLIKISSGMDMRQSVKGYNLDYINGIMYILSAIILVSYLMYTLSPEVAKNFGTYRLYYTIVFVIAGIFRYLQIALVENNTGSPTDLLYKDKFIQVCLALWLTSFYFIIYYPDVQIFLD
jgi:decaprenyl-phosphate phosphoribosyltransferase